MGWFGHNFVRVRATSRAAPKSSGVAWINILPLLAINRNRLCCHLGPPVDTRLRLPLETSILSCGKPKSLPSPDRDWRDTLRMWAGRKAEAQSTDDGRPARNSPNTDQKC